jgi:small subunit ribosomal protein S9
LLFELKTDFFDSQPLNDMSEQETATTAPVETPAAQTAPTPAEPAVAAVPAEPQGPRTFVWGVGRRKSAVARVRITQGTGKIEINGRGLNEFLTNERDRKAIFGPLEVTNTGGKLDIFARCSGGGSTGQAGAIVMGIGRALLKYDGATEASLRTGGFLTRDSRMKERKKYGQRGARRRFQFSKR